MRRTMLMLGAVMMAGVAMAEGPVELQKTLPDGRIAMAREGSMGTDGTARYSLRIYGAPEKPEQTPTNCLGGLERPQEGRIERMELIDLNGDEQPEIVVLMRAPDSSMFAAEAFRCDDQRLDMVASVKGIPQGNADVIETLRAKLSGKPASVVPAAASGEAADTSAGEAVTDSGGRDNAAADESGFTAGSEDNAAPKGSEGAESPSDKAEAEPAPAGQEPGASGSADAAAVSEEQKGMTASEENVPGGNEAAKGAGETGTAGEPRETGK
ncbi:MAG: PliI family lysozyme inhibitor of I-type lysozyme [bacterium]|nr:PliI family lysozyme inhibitor of I-type lysozyme [bacterium]